MTANPEQCAVGYTFYAAPSFGSSFWDTATSGFSYGSTIDSPTSGITKAFAYRYIPNIANLHIEMSYDFREFSGTSISNVITYNGIGVCPRSANTATAPSGLSNYDSPRGAWALATFACFFPDHNAYIGYNNNAFYNASCLLDRNTTYLGNSITIDVGPDLGGNTYAATVRLQIPMAGIDETRIIDDPLHLIDNASGGTDGYIALSGPVANTSDGVFRVTSLYIVGTGLPSVCVGVEPSKSSILPESTGNISHARILKQHRGAAEAEAFHNLIKERTA